MASEDRAATTALSRLEADGPRYGFFQALRLLRRDYPDRAAFEAAVRFQPTLGLGFAGNDIEQIETDASGKVRVRVNFFGLYGVSSPLPTFYTEDLIDEARNGRSAMRDFIDIVHNALYPMLFQVWEKYRLWLGVVESRERQRHDLLLALIGRMDADRRLPREAELLRFAGLMTHMPRSALGLQTLVRGLIGFGRVRVEPCVLNVIAVPANARCELGSASATLGGTLLGTEVARRSGVVNIHVRQLNAQRFSQLLPGGQVWQRLVRQLTLYLHEPVCCRLILYPDPPARLPLALGQTGHARLGLDAWLGEALPDQADAPVKLTLLAGDEQPTFAQGAFA
ncbi:type VI secretion system baseplate subunit TssG [Paraburkholderia bonniea]|uniref:type VI secretion system baseplate subunit TssG n=1 Tax=Paraburkholderia bonniea TaxID=2152891 RepID=UPI00257258A6|nr:type VI secretion system baseplate subunit TssG [Paraburkholderia bonniea]WJF89274.1 type VI secretion system baseplate subunit TssG [Paraburkholderia bonniea]WJF92590.1 type VI secretion system baseplate subunit TssG [Paraburkholderia bonniea]